MTDRNRQNKKTQIQNRIDKINGKQSLMKTVITKNKSFWQRNKGRIIGTLAAAAGGYGMYTLGQRQTANTLDKQYIMDNGEKKYEDVQKQVVPIQNRELILNPEFEDIPITDTSGPQQQEIERQIIFSTLQIYDQLVNDTKKMNSFFSRRPTQSQYNQIQQRQHNLLQVMLKYPRLFPEQIYDLQQQMGIGQRITEQHKQDIDYALNNIFDTKKWQKNKQEIDFYQTPVSVINQLYLADLRELRDMALRTGNGKLLHEIHKRVTDKQLMNDYEQVLY